MTKIKKLTKRLGIEAGIVLLILGALGGVMMLTDGMATAAAEKKTQAESGLSQDNGQLSALRTQLDRSGEAEKRFVEIQLARTNLDFSSNTDELTGWMRSAKGRYRFANNFKLNLPPEKKTDKAELSGLDYLINARDGVTLELEAISDIYVYSFIEEMMRGSPGFIRMTGFEIERKGDLDAQAFSQVMSGMSPSNVTAKLRFNWIGINPKPNPLLDKTATSAAGAPIP